MSITARFLLFGALAIGVLRTDAADPVVGDVSPDHKALVYVIRIEGEIGQPSLYILRRGLKEATEHHADAVVLDMDTLGGAADAALDMMEALDHFPGLTITFVDRQAMSAGAFIAAATREIWFEPHGIIGA
ncbi:MAG TPA: hypothetical protein VGM73_17480, partial [Candidatus Didemnitutus sp.]